jgi:hypothetical protein
MNLNLNYKEISENNWSLREKVIKKQKNKNIYINNKYPLNFNTSSHKKVFSCGICSLKMQSKIWFSNSKYDYSIACNHIKDIILAIEYSNQQNSIREWPKEWPFPYDRLTIEKYILLNNELNNPNKKQTYFQDSFENLDSLIPIPTYYDTINYYNYDYNDYNIVKKYGKFYCNCCNFSIYNTCEHIDLLVLKEKKLLSIINISLLLANKFFEE